MKLPVSNYPIVRFEREVISETQDLVVTEEPLSLVLIHGPAHSRQETDWAVSMRTPGQDEALAVGYLFTEGIIKQASDVLSMRYCVKKEEESGNRLLIHLDPSVEIRVQERRNDSFLNSSCGVCGKQAIEQVFRLLPKIQSIHSSISARVLLELEPSIKAKQPVFRNTGGLHACSLFAWSGELLLQREDVGRHNALDKLLGAALLQPQKFDLFHTPYLVHLSGRAGFEMVQKAAMAGIPIVTSIGAPSSLAVELALKTGITLIGFLRDNRFNVYAYPENINFNL